MNQHKVKPTPQIIVSALFNSVYNAEDEEQMNAPPNQRYGCGDKDACGLRYRRRRVVHQETISNHDEA